MKKLPLAWLALALLPLFGACRNDQAPAADDSSSLTAEQKERMEFVRQPKQDWQPEGAARKLNILLLMDKTKIRKGENVNYRLESQNTGREPLVIKEDAPSFTLDGSLCGSSAFKFYATPPDGKEQLLSCRPKAAAAPAAGKPAESALDVTLQPGEYLLTRGYGPAARFRELQTKFPFETLGVYRLKVAYAPKDGPRAESNTVNLEVVP